MAASASLLFYAALVAAPIYAIALVIYRLTLHPLARFPGPKISAATRWYEFYYDVIRGSGGEFALQVDKMHEKYGPIVRINPDELHIQDSEYYRIFYTGVRHKYGWAAKIVGAEQASFGTKDHDLHKLRRSANTKFLSKRTVLAREFTVIDAMAKLMKLFKEQSGTVIDLEPPLLAFSSEAVRQFCLNSSTGLFEDAEARLRWSHSIRELTVAIGTIKQFSWMTSIANHLPMQLLRAASPPIAELISVHKGCTRDAEAFLNDHTKHSPDSNVFSAICDSPALPPAEKTAHRLSQEAFTILTAAGNTTTHHLTFGVYYLLSNPDKMARFQQALRELKDEIPDWTTLSSHPYIRATIKEILRLRGMTAGRSPFTSSVPLQYNEWTIPADCAVSLTVRDVLLDPKIFHDPHSFLPERWLADDAADLEPFFIPFAKGPRNCQGLELAWAEMYIGMGAMFRNFDFELVDMDYERDLRYKREFLVAMASAESKGVRVKMTYIGA